jgi:excisionase family DNA binding protein
MAKNNNDGGLIFPPILTVPDAAEGVRCSRRFLQYKIATGELPSIRLGRRCVRIRGRDLAAFLEKHATA